MKMVLVVYSGADPHTVSSVLETHHVHGYTQLAHAHGVGSSGRREGSRAWPGDSAVFFSAVPAEQADALLSALEDVRAALPTGERLHAMVMPVERFL